MANTPLFPLGRIVATPGVLEAVDGGFVRDCLQRHIQGDWGEVGPEDWAANDRALTEGDRLLSAYKDPTTGVKVWVITEADRVSTCALLPEDY